MTVDLRLGDCLIEMPTLEAQSVDAVIADIPYGTTACKWDTVIPFAPMWAELKRIAKPKAAIVLFGSQPFTSALVMSNPGWFRYEWVWEKSRKTGFLDCNKKPLKAHESISVFSANGHTYNPQMMNGKPHSRGGSSPGPAQVWGKFADRLKTGSNDYYPFSIVYFPVEPIPEHPTQKPVALMEYLIRTYTNEGDTVLDFTMGSGTTMVACVNTKRNGIGIEKDADYFKIAERRIHEAQAQLTMALA